jgi:hypothetical protein
LSKMLLSSTRNPELLALPFKYWLVRCASCTNKQWCVCVFVRVGV